MKRRTLDITLATVGLVVAVVMAIAGGVLLYAGNFAHTTVSDELAAQQIAFPPATALPPELQQYAGQQVTTGPLAKEYAAMIAGHLQAVAGGKTYSQVSEEWIASSKDPAARDQALGAQRQTLFMGETLRGLLLNTYAFWIFGTIAIVGAFVAWAAALVLLALAIVGFVHARRHANEVVFAAAPAIESIPA